MRKKSSLIFMILIFVLLFSCQSIFSLSKWIEFGAEWHYVPDLTVLQEHELPPEYNILEEDPVEKKEIVEINGVIYVVELE